MTNFSEEYYENNPGMKGVHTREKISQFVKRNKGNIGALLISASLLFPQSAYSQDTVGPIEVAMKESSEMIKYSDLQLIERYGIPTEEFEYWSTEELEYYTGILKLPEYGIPTGILWKNILLSTGINFGAEDIPSILELVIAKNSGDKKILQETCDWFLSLYSGFSPELEKIFISTGYKIAQN